MRKASCGTHGTSKKPGILAWIHLMRIYHKIQRYETAHLEEYELTLPQFDVLAHLQTGEGITQQALANQLLVTKGNVCGLIDRMTEQGLVERRSDPEDRRANMLHLTPKGKGLICEVGEPHRDMIAELIGNLSYEKQKQLLDILSELDRALPEEQPP